MGRRIRLKEHGFPKSDLDSLPPLSLHSNVTSGNSVRSVAPVIPKCQMGKLIATVSGLGERNIQTNTTPLAQGLAGNGSVIILCFLLSSLLRTGRGARTGQEERCPRSQAHTCSAGRVSCWGGGLSLELASGWPWPAGVTGVVAAAAAAAAASDGCGASS